MKRMLAAVLLVSGAGFGPGPAASAQTAKPKAEAAKPAAGATARPAARRAAVPAPAAPLTEDEQALFAFGQQMGGRAKEMVKPLELTPAELAVFKKGLAAGIDGQQPTLPPAQVQQRLSARASANAARVAAQNDAKGAAFREGVAAEAGAKTTASGLVFRSLQPGGGASPKATDTVRVKYRGTLVDGTPFDSSPADAPASFPLDGVIRCWTEGLQLMKVGEKARLVCPAAIAYGERGHGSIPPGSTLVFEVELVGIGPEAKATQ